LLQVSALFYVLDAMTKNKKWSLACLLVVLASAPLRAGSIGYEFTTAPVSVDSRLSIGFEFSTLSSVTVDSLGYFDYDGDGFLTPHTIGIFDSSGNLVTSTTLGTGTSSTLNGQFRYQDIAPITLPGGQTWTLAATTDGNQDVWAYGNAYSADGTVTLEGMTTNPAILIPENAALFTYESDDTLLDPTSHASNYTLYAGPNFTFYTDTDLHAAPEPSYSGLLSAIAAIFVCMAVRRARTSA